MAALPGRLEDWQQDKEGRWCNPDFTGLVTVAPPMTFAEYFAKRAEPEPIPVDKYAELEARLVALEQEITDLKSV
jgi:hypothetical protein